MKTRTLFHYTATVLAVPLALNACAGSETVSEDSGWAPSNEAEQLLARSIEFHDPSGIWADRTVSLAWNGTGSEGEERVALDLSIEPDGSTFSMSGRYRGHEIEYSTTDAAVTVSVNGSSNVPEEISAEMRLERENGMFWRSYFGYLVGLPMKLTDPGTHIDPQPIETDFMGGAVDAIRVTYDADVGGDTWYFYFDPSTAEVVGCRFYHDESVNDGEYIVFEGLVEADGLRLPARRSWYVNADDRFLGADEVSRLSASP